MALLISLLPHVAHAAWPSDPRVNVPICTAPGVQYSAEIVSDGAAGAIIAWVDSRNGSSNSDIYAARVLWNGSVDPGWPAQGSAICSAMGNQNSLAIMAVDGGAIVAWVDRRNGAYEVFAHMVRSDGTVHPAWPTDGRLIAQATLISGPVLLAPDHQGGAIIAWTDYHNSVDFDVYAHHLLADGTLDPSWPVTGRVLCDVALDQYARDIVSDGIGGAIVVWEDRRNGTDFDIYVHHVLVSGEVDPAWPPGGRVVSPVVRDQFDGSLVTDRAGGAVVAWTDQRSADLNQDIYAQHVLAGGVIDSGWPTHGSPVCVASGDQRLSGLVTDGEGGALVTWSGASGVHAHRILPTGGMDTAWPTNGRDLSLTFQSQWSPEIVGDGVGGAIISWSDDHYVPAAILAHHVLPDGTVDPLWPMNGRVLSNATGEKSYAKIIPDGAGGAIAAWGNYRVVGTNYDIYAQRVGPTGVLGGDVIGVADEASTGLALRLVGPNPLRSGDVTVQFSLPSRDGASLSIVDVSGRLVAHREMESQVAGVERMTISGGARLPGGLYFVLLRQRESTRVAKLVVLP